MAGLERLVPLIYHEKQQQGSQLCAQHALNAALQGDYFQAPDLAQYAHQLDALEGAVNADAGPTSNNMDDTGFFSVGVLERALHVWGFSLVRWRSEELREQQQNPHHQMAFILNHQEHWFTLRRFGNLEDPENGHWFNLNSFLTEPEWVGKLYLGMVLSQAEDEGYSVFAVIPTGEHAATLPRTDADDVASTLPQPTSAGLGSRISTSRTHSTSEAVSSKPTTALEGFEDEDMELQAALQASLAAGGAFDYAAFSDLPHPAPQMSRPDPSASASTAAAMPDPDDISVEAMMARNLARSRALMERMQREQEAALREGYEEEVARHFGGPDIGSARRVPTNTGEDEVDEEEHLRRAIEASRAAHPENVDTMEVERDDDDDGDWLQPRSTRDFPAAPRVPVARASASHDRVYDDEDEELQAALKASLEGLPEGFVMPATPPRQEIPPVSRVERTAEVVVSPSAVEEGEVQPEPAPEPEPEPEPEPLNAEELRKRRLARFGSA